MQEDDVLRQAAAMGSPPPIINASIDPGLARWLEDLQEEFDLTKHRLKCEIPRQEFDKDKGKYWVWERPEGVKPFMNELGINYIDLVLNSFVNKNSLMAHIDDRDIEEIGRDTADTIIDHLGQNLVVYDIDLSLLVTIDSIISNFIFFTLKRSWKGGERSLIRDTTKHGENFSSQPQKQPGGFKLPGF